MTDKPIIISRTTEITFVDKPSPGNAKYPQMLAAIKGEQLENVKVRGKWALLNSFANEGTARDTAYRLGKAHTEFEFKATRNSGEDVTVVFARLKDEVNE